MSAPQSETSFWVLRGTMGSVSFAWSSAPATGYDHRLTVDPSAFSIGPAPTVSSSPERPQVKVTLDNSDDALSRYVVGTPWLTSDQAHSEFSQASLLQVRAKLYRAIVAGASVVEHAYTPTLILLGGIDVSDKGIGLSLAADDDPMLGQVQALYRVDEVIEKSGTVVWEGYGGSGAVFLWEEIKTAARISGLDTLIPWLYGNTAVRPIEIRTGSWVSLYIIGFVDPVDPLDPYAWMQEGASLKYGRWYDAPGLFLVELDVGFLLCMAWTADAVEARKDGEIWLARAEDELAEAPVGDVIRAILDRHSKAGSDSYDLSSLTAASDMMGRYRGALAGVIAAETTMREVLEQICAPIGLRVWIGTNDKLHFASREISHAQLQGLDENLIPRIEPWDDYPSTVDGMPSWAETIPSGPEEIGAAASRVTVDWPEWALTMLPQLTRDRRIAGLGGELAAPDAELRIPGDWLNPAMGTRILDMLSDRSAYPVRSVSMAMHPAIALAPIGTLMRLTHPWGIGGFELRLVRMMRVEVRPAEHSALASFEDLGPVEMLAVGKLDSISSWVAYNPETDPHRAEMTLRFEEGSAFLYGKNTPVPSGRFAFTEDHVGMTIWGPPSIHPDYPGVTSYEILSADPAQYGYELEAGAGVVIWPPYALEGGTDPILPVPVPAPQPGASLLDSPWLVMMTHQWEDGLARPGYITGSDVATGAGRGFRFARG